jgi:hypothetical protein
MERAHRDTVHVSAPGAALTSAIKAMTTRSWKVLHREVWHQFNLEQDRRGQGLDEGTIRLTRQAWNNLPDTIRGYISLNDRGSRPLCRAQLRQALASIDES